MLLYDSGCRTRKHLFFLINGFTSLSFSGLLAFKLVGVGFLGDYCQVEPHRKVETVLGEV